jgi:hypothetical protein
MSGNPRRLLAAAVIPAAVAAVLLACGCGGSAASGPAAAAGGAANGLQHQTPDQVVHDAVAALRAARSVQFTLRPPPAMPGRYRIAAWQVQGAARIALVTEGGRPQFKVAVAGGRAYIQFSTAGMKLPYWLSPLRHVIAGRWFTLSMPRQGIRVFDRLPSPALLARQLAHHDRLFPGVRQATLNGRKVVVVTDGGGDKLYVANTGPAYPLLLTAPDGHRLAFSGYGANFGVPAPRDALPGGPSYTGPALA